MFTARWTRQARLQYDALQLDADRAAAGRRKSGKKKSSKQEGLFKQVQKALQFLQSNPRHPGLRTHEFSSLENPYDESEKVFEAYAQNQTPDAYRIFWCYGSAKGEITIIAITPHP